MIYLCTDKDLIIEGIRSIDGTRCIKEIILLYLDSYGTDYDFNQFYVQCDDNSKFSAVIHRYNSFVYISADTLCNSAELENFISGFSGCQIISDNINFMTDLNSECCYVMSKAGETSDFFSDNIRPCLSPAEISELVCKDMNDENKVDFLLNTAHQIRHGVISVYGYFIGNKPVCVLSCTNVNTDYSVLTFVYTDEYFRGNGYMRKLISEICCDPDKYYMLLCEEHNVPFYKKCGFEISDRCIKLNL